MGVSLIGEDGYGLAASAGERLPRAKMDGGFPSRVFGALRGIARFTPVVCPACLFRSCHRETLKLLRPDVQKKLLMGENSTRFPQDQGRTFYLRHRRM